MIPEQNSHKLSTDYLHELTLHKRSTRNVKYALGIFFKYLADTDTDPLRLKIRDAQEFQIYLSTKTKDGRSIQYSKGSILAIMGALSSFYEYLKRQKLIYSNPFLEVERVKTGKSLPRNILNEKDMSKFLNHLKRFGKGENLDERKKLYKAHVIGELLYSTGARINEVMKLKPVDIDFNRGVIRVQDNKTGELRDCILNQFAEKVLRIYVDEMREYVLFGKNNADTSLLFGSKKHLITWLNSVLRKESEKLKFGKFTSHNFRHAVGYHLLKAGCDIRYIQEVLGHKRLTSTEIYTKVDKEDLRHVIDTFHPRVLSFKRREKAFAV